MTKHKKTKASVIQAIEYTDKDIAALPLDFYIANKQGQKTYHHNAAVSIRSFHILKLLDPDFSLEENTYKNIAQHLSQGLAEGTIRHDEGKYIIDFASYMKSVNDPDPSNDDSAEASRIFIGPYHQEISWYLLTRSISMPNITTKIRQSNNNLSIKDISGYSIYWHHAADVDEKGNIKRNSMAQIEKAIFLRSDGKERSDSEFESFLNIVDQGLKASSSIMLKHMSNFNHPIAKDYSAVANHYISNGFSLIECDRNTPVYQHEADNNDLIDCIKGGIKKAVLFILKEADHWVSSLSKDELEYLLENPLDSKWNSEINKFPSDGNWQNKITSLFDNIKDQRTKKQFEAASKASNYHTSFMEADTGAGKTAISLFWAALGDKPRNLCFALPMQDIVTNVYKTSLGIDERTAQQSDLKRISGINYGEITAEAVFAGERQFQQGDIENNPLLSSDICFVTWDRLLSPQYEKRQFSEFMRCLFSDLIIDEPQDLLGLPTMLPALGELLFMRRLFKGVGRTLIMTATHPWPVYELMGIGSGHNGVYQLDKNKYGYIKRNELMETHQDKKLYSALSFDNTPSLAEIFAKAEQVIGKAVDTKDMIVSTNRISQAIDFALEFIPNHIKNDIFSMVAHSGTSPKDKKMAVLKALDEYGTLEPAFGMLFTALMMITSHQINCKSCTRELGLPHHEIQAATGRAGRKAGKECGVVIFYTTKHTDKVFNNTAVGFHELHKLWTKHIISLLGKPIWFTNREFTMVAYDDFMSKPESYNAMKKGINNKLKDALEKLKIWFPVKGIIGSGVGLNGQKRGGFRENGKLFTAAIFNPTSDIFTKGLKHLPIDDLMNESDWMEICMMQDAMDKEGRKEASKVLIKEGFTIDNKGNVHGSWFGKRVEMPLAISLLDESNKFNTDFSQKLKTKAQEKMKDDKKEGSIYIRGIGLVTVETARKIKDTLIKSENTEQKLIDWADSVSIKRL